ncbi:hypothetical protein [Caulobacter sp.]|uniref:hypothetical protein n=1 Tax=Caulobacter sp. TaxID=78 RepID=UPI003BAAFD75
MRAKPPDRKAPDRKTPDSRAQARKAALKALERARRAADKAGVELSDWEGEFLGSVAQRIQTYGRAFGDPEKGGRDQALSANQTIKLKEIVAKAKGEKKPLGRGKGFGRRERPVTVESEPED